MRPPRGRAPAPRCRALAAARAPWRLGGMASLGISASTACRVWSRRRWRVDSVGVWRWWRGGCVWREQLGGVGVGRRDGGDDGDTSNRNVAGLGVVDPDDEDYDTGEPSGVEDESIDLGSDDSDSDSETSDGSSSKRDSQTSLLLQLVSLYHHHSVQLYQHLLLL